MQHKWYYYPFSETDERRLWNADSDLAGVETIYSRWSVVTCRVDRIFGGGSGRRSGYQASIWGGKLSDRGPIRKTATAAVKDAEALADLCLVNIAAAIGLMTGRYREPADVYDDQGD